ncbi:U11/U12 small nuclear ribonucleoprotein 25 kDa protein-like [Bacillus rossius redtenbacheri]|uniref:U11/U12 small nuclear ribonucleoprotein 25 kDa protein-like n=1 Tax=Bacillus rossius redtenbacheri TaxID=93214 RepID=UPI002FDE0523
MSTADEAGTGGREPEALSHEELLEVTGATLADLLGCDPLMSDLPRGVTPEEVGAQVALEQGQSMTVRVVRADGEELAVVVPQRGATVGDLKSAIRRHVTLTMARDRRPVTVSWRYVWRTYWLYHDVQKLKDDGALLAEFGIRNKSKVKFVKRLHEKGTP